MIKTPPSSAEDPSLSRKSLQKEVPDSTKRLDDLMPSDLDVQKENLTEDKASEVVKTDTYESAIGFKKFSGIG
ncbi:hypothetical protein Tco_0780272 [Tanacetum coccineum]